jgi:Fe2+ transport system protein FeoA
MGAGASCLVCSVQGSPEVVERLAALGLVPGSPFRVLSAGSPMTVAVGESRFALGASWASALRVIPT